MNKKFLKICRKTQSELKSYVADRLTNTHKNVIVGDGYVFAEGTFPVLLVAHLDTVHHETPKVIAEDDKGNYSSPEGIGGDDRCGVYMIFQILKKHNCSVVFCEDEEIGMVGARKFTNAPFFEELKYNYIIEFDRANANDAVFYSCDNKDFEAFITEEFYDTNYGSFSDISTIAPAMGCAAVNLSCGYYKAHTKNEYVNMAQMEASIEAACKILDRTTEKDVFEYVEKKYSWPSYYSGYYNYNTTYSIKYLDGDKTKYYTVWKETEDEAILDFLKNHPDICYGQIQHVYSFDDDDLF